MTVKLISALLVFAPLVALAKSQNVEYTIEGQVHEAYVATPDTAGDTFPGVLIVHDWMGPGEYSNGRADLMAKEGYIAVAADIYGKDVRPKNPKEAGAQAGKYKGNTKLFRAKMQAALDLLKRQKGVDPKRIVVFGYCFGGTAALELARTGVDVAGIASFHGGLKTADRADNAKIKTKVLIMHGAVDPNVPDQEVKDFTTDLDKAKTDYQFIAYSGAVHAFTNPKAGNNPQTGAAYNEAADKRSWKHFQDFLAETAPAKR